MQSTRVTHISPAEWRWVFIVGGLLTALTLVPYAWALTVNSTATGWQFMGILANPQDGATYLAKIGQGMRGAWLLHFMHTPEPHTGAAIQLFYLLLGHLARLIGVSSLVIFHLARVLTTLFMFSALYHLGATIWTRQRARRLFFILTAVGSGLGWLLLVLAPAVESVPDLTVPEAYPLYSAYANPHFPLAIGSLAMLVSIYLNVFQIGSEEEPTVTNGGLAAFALTLIITFVLPQGLVPFGGALALYVLLVGIRKRAIPVMHLRWASMFFLPAMVMGLYYYVVLRYNPIMDVVWNGQVDATTAAPGVTLLAYGLLLLTAIPGLARALANFEEDGDQLMLIWFVVNLVAVFLPFNQQRRFMFGLIIPITFFAVRGLEDYWLPRIAARWQPVVLGLLVALVMPSNILALGIPLFGLINPEAGLDQRLLVQPGYWEAMNYLDEVGKPDDIVLAGPNVSLWIPAWAGKRVVYGHPWETINAPQKLAAVEAWYQGADCEQLVTQYNVRYILVGPQEAAITAAGDGGSCLDMLTGIRQTVEFSGVTLYERFN